MLTVHSSIPGYNCAVGEGCSVINIQGCVTLILPQQTRSKAQGIMVKHCISACNRQRDRQMRLGRVCLDNNRGVTLSDVTEHPLYMQHTMHCVQITQITLSPLSLSFREFFK